MGYNDQRGETWAYARHSWSPNGSFPKSNPEGSGWVGEKSTLQERAGDSQAGLRGVTLPETFTTRGGRGCEATDT